MYTHTMIKYNYVYICVHIYRERERDAYVAECPSHPRFNARCAPRCRCRPGAAPCRGHGRREGISIIIVISILDCVIVVCCPFSFVGKWAVRVHLLRAIYIYIYICTPHTYVYIYI